MTEHDFKSGHPDAISLARFLDGTASVDERPRIEAHLADCPDCREDLLEARRIIATRPRRRWGQLIPLAAAAAAIFLVWSGISYLLPNRTVTRDPALTTTLAPEPLTPLGELSRIDSLKWTAVPGTLRYRLSLFSPDGQVLWRTTSSDTSVALPDSFHLTSKTPYYWQIKAETGYGRWVESELVTFTLTDGGEPR